MRLDIITLRTSQRQSIEERVLHLAAALSDTPNGPSVAVYLRDPPMSDLSVHLLWVSHNEGADQCGTQFAAALRELGSVDHAVWRRLTCADLPGSDSPPDGT